MIKRPVYFARLGCDDLAARVGYKFKFIIYEELYDEAQHSLSSLYCSQRMIHDVKCLGVCVETSRGNSKSCKLWKQQEFASDLLWQSLYRIPVVPINQSIPLESLLSLSFPIASCFKREIIGTICQWRSLGSKGRVPIHPFLESCVSWIYTGSIRNWECFRCEPWSQGVYSVSIYAWKPWSSDAGRK